LRGLTIDGELSKESIYSEVALLKDWSNHISLEELSFLIFNHADKIVNFFLSIDLIFSLKNFRQDLPIRKNYF